MDLHQLYIFTKVAEYKSFSKAADAIYLSQSTVSSHIQSLEKMLNVKVFDRIGREILLTPQGERLYYWAQKLLALKDQAVLDVNKSQTRLDGIIRLGASSVPSQCIVPKLVKKFRGKYANITFSICQSSSKTIADKVLEGTIDAGVIGELYGNDKLEYIPLQKERLVLITAGDKFHIQAPVKMEDIIHLPFILRNSNSGTFSMLKRFLKKKGIKEEHLNVAAYTDTTQSLVEFVRQGIGISIISELAAKEYEASHLFNVYKIEDFQDERFFYLVYNKKKTHSMIAKLFIKMASEERFSEEKQSELV